MDPTKLKEIWAEHGFRPEKRLGQNFLMDKNVRDKLIGAYSLEKEDVVLEIGPGFGMMSFEAAKDCAHLYAVEMDKRIYSIMSGYFREAGNMTLINGDILETDIRAAAKGASQVKVIGNIPYGISTPIIARLVAQKECVNSAYLVMQDELATRIVSSPGSRDFGSISCYVQYHASVRKVFKIYRNCFFPKPAVDSCLVKFDFRSEPAVQVKDEKLFFDIVHKAFSERRKQVVNPLSSGGFLGMDKKAWTAMLEGCGVSSTLRAEDLSLKDYARITERAAEVIGNRKA